MSFDVAFERVLGHEGAYTSGENDPGGETKWGISKRSYPNVDIKNLTQADAKVIYRRDFWECIHADELPHAVAFQAFDFAVNSGIGTAVRALQRAAGVADDGWWGPITRRAVEGANEANLLMRFNAIRLEYMTRLSGWPTFGRGWSRRIAANLMYAAEDNT